MKNKNNNFTNINGNDNIVGDNNTSNKNNKSLIKTNHFIVVICIIAIIFSVILALATNKNFQAVIKDFFTVSVNNSE